MVNETQIKEVRNHILEFGYVDRNWCLEKYITRLSAIIYNLKEEGFKIEGSYVEKNGGKDFRYVANEIPEKYQKGQMKLI